ncbi:MAG: hypothetical protein AAGJ09_02950 [Pseudomonadota bacterium]
MKKIALAFLLITLAAPSWGQDGSIFPQGSSFGVIPFDGSTPAADFSGFIDQETLRSVMITELPKAGAKELFVGMQQPANLATQGITAETIETLEIAGMPALRIKGTQEAQGLPAFPKCILLVEGDASTGLISAQMPMDTNGNACDLIQGVVQRAKQSLEEQVAGLPFRVQSIGNMRIADTLGGSALMLSKAVAGSGNKPMMIISHSLGAQQSVPGAEQRMLISMQMLDGITNYYDYAIETSYEVNIDNAPGTAILATATEVDSERKVRLVQWVRFASDGNIRLLAESDRDAFRDHFADFQTVRDGLRAN